MVRDSRVEAVGTTFAVLEAVASHGPGGADITTICRTTGISRRTVYRHLATLRELGILESAKAEFGLYRLGTRIEQWAAQSSRQREFMVQSRTQVDAVAQTTGHLVHCTVYDQGSVLTVAAARKGENPGIATVGTRRPAHATASGKVFLGHSPHALEAYITRPLTPLTEQTLTAPEQLRRAALEAVRNGYAVDEHEFSPGICCVAVPVWGDRKVVGALSVSLRWPAGAPFHPGDDILGPLKDAAIAFTNGIGGRVK